jgi:hypothetical protein
MMDMKTYEKYILKPLLIVVAALLLFSVILWIAKGRMKIVIPDNPVRFVEVEK